MDIEHRGHNLRVAAYKGDKAAVYKFLEREPSSVHLIARKDKSTVLHHAAAGGHNSIVSLLLAFKANVDQEDINGCTPLHTACFHGHLHCVRLLLQAGANVLHRDVDECTPLHKAAFSGNSECLLLVLESLRKLWSEKGNSDFVNVVDNERNTPLHRAAFHGHVNCVRVLLDKGGNGKLKDIYLRSVVHHAARAGNVQILEMLRKRGLELDAVDKDGVSPVMQACAQGHERACHFLVTHGADIDRKTSGNLWTALHIAASGGHVEILLLLILEGSLIDERDAFGRTPLHCAVEAEKVECVRILLKVGADPKCKDYMGISSVDLAKELKNAEKMFETFREVRAETLAQLQNEMESAYGLSEWFQDSWTWWWKQLTQILYSGDAVNGKTINTTTSKVYAEVDFQTIYGEERKRFYLQRVKWSSSIFDVKDALSQKYGIPTDVMKIFLLGRKEPLEDHETFGSHYNKGGTLVLTHYLTESLKSEE